MRSYFKLTVISLLVCALILSLAACASPKSAEQGDVGASALSTPVPSESPSAPQTSEVSEAPLIGSNSTPVSTDEMPEVTGDVPAMHPDEDTQLTYTVGEEERTVSAIRHYTLHGYSIVYDTEHYVCNPFTEGDSYWAGEGNYLSVSLIFGMPIEDVLTGLRLQENIAMEPQSVTIGSKGYAAQTLCLTTPSGLYRQFWALDFAGDVLLVEQSYDVVSDDTELYRNSQLAMLDTLTLLY